LPPYVEFETEDIAMTQAQTDRTDAAMLQSMAASLRAGMGFSFNPADMADLLDRVAAKTPR
jgi:hypothetical protein